MTACNGSKNGITNQTIIAMLSAMDCVRRVRGWTTEAEKCRFALNLLAKQHENDEFRWKLGQMEGNFCDQKGI